jgi:hypothetical protein
VRVVDEFSAAPKMGVLWHYRLSPNERIGGNPRRRKVDMEEEFIIDLPEYAIYYNAKQSILRRSHGEEMAFHGHTISNLGEGIVGNEVDKFRQLSPFSRRLLRKNNINFAFRKANK